MSGSEKNTNEMKTYLLNSNKNNEIIPNVGIYRLFYGFCSSCAYKSDGFRKK